MNDIDIKTLREIFKQYKEEHKYWLEAKFDAIISKMNDIKIAYEELKDDALEYRNEYLRQCPVNRAECKEQMAEKFAKLEAKVDILETTFLSRIPARTMKYVIMAIVISSFISSLVTIITETPIWKHLLQRVGIGIGG